MFDSRRVSGGALLLLPAALVAYFAFSAGGFYPGPSAYLAMLVAIALFLRVAGAATPLREPAYGHRWRWRYLPPTPCGR
jgi:hypothetical protein